MAVRNETHLCCVWLQTDITLDTVLCLLLFHFSTNSLKQRNWKYCKYFHFLCRHERNDLALKPIELSTAFSGSIFLPDATLSHPLRLRKHNEACVAKTLADF